MLSATGLGKPGWRSPNAQGSSADTRLLVKRTVLPVAPDTNKTAKDLAMLHLSEPVPASVTPAPLQFPESTNLVTTRWWALGFPPGDLIGSTAAGTVRAGWCVGGSNWMPIVWLP